MNPTKEQVANHLVKIFSEAGQFKTSSVVFTINKKPLADNTYPVGNNPLQLVDIDVLRKHLGVENRFMLPDGSWLSLTDVDSNSVSVTRHNTPSTENAVKPLKPSKEFNIFYWLWQQLWGYRYLSFPILFLSPSAYQLLFFSDEVLFALSFAFVCIVTFICFVIELELGTIKLGTIKGDSPEKKAIASSEVTAQGDTGDWGEEIKFWLLMFPILLLVFFGLKTLFPQSDDSAATSLSRSVSRNKKDRVIQPTSSESFANPSEGTWAGLVGLSVDPTPESFEKFVKYNIQRITQLVPGLSPTDQYRFDLRKTDSVVSPFIGNFSQDFFIDYIHLIKGDPAIEINFRYNISVVFGFVDGEWQCQDVTVVKTNDLASDVYGGADKRMKFRVAKQTEELNKLPDRNNTYKFSSVEQLSNLQNNIKALGEDLSQAAWFKVLGSRIGK